MAVAILVAQVAAAAAAIMVGAEVPAVARLSKARTRRGRVAAAAADHPGPNAAPSTSKPGRAGKVQRATASSSSPGSMNISMQRCCAAGLAIARH